MQFKPLSLVGFVEAGQLPVVMLLASVFADLRQFPDYQYFADVDSPELPAELEEAPWQACLMPAALAAAATVAHEQIEKLKTQESSEYFASHNSVMVYMGCQTDVLCTEWHLEL
ncbi:hypothetical protein ACOSQ2_002999 [Xanthoceras sorbifolium]